MIRELAKREPLAFSCMVLYFGAFVAVLVAMAVVTKTMHDKSAVNAKEQARVYEENTLISNDIERK